MKQRVISSLVMLPLLIFVFIGGTPLFILNLIIAVWADVEFVKAAKLTPKENRTTSFTLKCVLYAIFIPLALMSVSMIDKMTLAYPSEFANFDWLAFVIPFGSDAFAYFVGCSMGKHKLCPSISPKKTVEGSVGGTLGCMVLTLLFGIFIAPNQPVIHFILLGAFGSIASQLGDLTASWFKRRIGIKDYSNLIPGHGGILDRFDSVSFAAVFLYLYMNFCMR